jgi:hypothetical protein
MSLRPMTTLRTSWPVIDVHAWASLVSISAFV